MYNKIIISIKITFFILIFFTIFSIISIFLFSPTSSIKDFAQQIFNTKIQLSNNFSFWFNKDNYKLHIWGKIYYWKYKIENLDDYKKYILDNNDEIHIYKDWLINYIKDWDIFKTSNNFNINYASNNKKNIYFSHNGISKYQLTIDDKIYEGSYEISTWFKDDWTAEVMILNWEKDILDKKYVVKYSNWGIELLNYDFSLITKMVMLDSFYNIDIYDLNTINFYNFIFIKTISVILWIFLVVFYFIYNYFTRIEKFNKKLIDYNHFLAHEIKTPISVMHSNLEVLKYWFDIDLIKKSQDELKTITNIIDSLLHFAESLKITDLKYINLENFLKNYISTINLKWKKIYIHNKEFNYLIKTDEALFLRVIKNLLENALKYTFSQEVNIFIKNNQLVIENEIEKTMSTYEINEIYFKFYSNSKNKWSYWIWIPLIKEILKVLWYWFEIYSNNNKFYAVINFNNKNNESNKL